jgi:hypothetical protein
MPYNKPMNLLFSSPFAWGFHKFFAKRATLFLRFVADRKSATNRLPYLLEEAGSKGFERLPYSPATTTVGAEKHSRFSLNRLA